MVAVIAGNGLGLDNTSLTQLGQAQGGQAAQGQGQIRQYFNVASGNLVLQNQDEGLVFDGLPLNVLRTYNSQGQTTGNQGWLFGFTRSLGSVTGTVNTAGSAVSRTDDDGAVVLYTYNAALGAYVSQGQSGASDTLTWNSGSSTWTWTDGASRVQETYSATGQLQTLSDPETGASYSFNYNANGQLSSIVSGDGDTLAVGYTGNLLTSLTLSEIPPGGSTAVVRQQVGYSYDGQGRLQTVTTTLGSDTQANATNYTTTYTYDGTSDRVASVTQSDGTTVSYTYVQDSNGAYRVSTITTGSGAAAQTVTLGYNLATDTTTVTDALGNITTYIYNAAGQLTQVAAPSVNGSSPTTQYRYDANGNLLQVIDANGGLTAYVYDANGNRLSVEDPTGHTISYTYNADNQVTSQTTYTVPAQGVVGQSGYLAPSGAQTTYYVYDSSDRLNYVIDALGNVTEHDYGTSSGVTVLTSTKRYVGITYSLTGLSPTTPPTLAQLQGWVAGGSVQAVLGRMMRTDYSYDVRGQLSQAIQWDTLNSSGVGTLSTDSGAIVMKYTYDAQGRLLQQATARGSSRTTLETTSYAYDGLGRLVSVTDPLNHVTTYAYTDSGNQLAITQANGLTTTQVRNSAGQLISSTQSASGQTSRVTTYLYNSVGQQVATIDPAGNVSYTFYDADGRLAGTVDATGAVTVLTYDAAGHVVQTTQYATLISTSGWVSGGALTASYPASLPMPTSNANDRVAHTLYDTAGRVIATIDPVGNVVTTTYDGDGNAIRTTAYATPLTSAQWTALGSTPTWSALQADLTSTASDRISRTVYDADNQPVATIDAAGYVTATSYDAAGRIIKTTAYATALTGTQLTALGITPTLAAVQADLSTNASDQTTRTYYDDSGRVVAQVDADGYLTTTAYDATTHTTTATRYPALLTTAQLATLTGSETNAALVALLSSTAGGQVTTNIYDANGQLHQTTAPDGTVTVYTYNAVGQLTGTTVTPTAGQGNGRTTGAGYDAFGDVISTTDGNTKTTTYTYNTLGQRIATTDPVGNITYTYYDADGRVAYTVQGQPNGGVLNALGAVVAYTYNAFGQVATSRRYAGLLTLTTSGSSTGTTLNVATATTAQLATAASALANPSTDSTLTYTYTLNGQVSGTIDGLGYHTARTYDAFGDLVQQQQQLSAPGSSLTAANSTTTSYSYDVRGERTGETDGAGASVARTTAMTYDAFGRVTSATDARGSVVTYGYDNLGRQVSTSQTVQGTARTTVTTYDAFARVVKQTDALGNQTIYQYDLVNHKTTVTTADGVTVTTARDAFGDVLTVTDGANNTTTYTYDGDGNLLTAKDALGNVSSDQYDADGHLIQTTDATGHIVTYTYDASGRVLTRAVDPSGLNLKTTYTYDGQGRTLSVTDPTNTVTTYSYDADGNVLTKVQDAGTGKLNITTTYTYDGAGKTLTMVEAAGTAVASATQYIYDKLERLSQKIVDPTGLALTTSYAYDEDNNLVQVTDPNGNSTYTIYNEAGEVAYTITPAGAQGAGLGAISKNTYDADGRLVATRAYAGVVDTSSLATLLGGASVSLAKGAALAAGATTANDPISYKVYNADGKVIFQIDPMGNVTERRYNALGQMAETLAYANPVVVSAELASSLTAGAVQSTDIQSLLVQAGNSDASARVTYSYYDADGRVAYSVTPNIFNGVLGGAVHQTQYDAAGRVTADIAYGVPLPMAQVGGAATTASITQAVSSQNTPETTSLRQHIYDKAGRKVADIDPNGNISYTFFDADGRVALTVDAVGAVVRYTRDALGNVTKQTSYANPVNTSGWLSAGTVTVTASAVAPSLDAVHDRVIQTQYDQLGRVSTVTQVYTLTGNYSYGGPNDPISYYGQATTYTNGESKQYSYDRASRLVSEVDVDLGGKAAQRVTRYFYDQDGQQVALLDANGYLTTYVYDAGGHVTHRAAFATAVDVSLRSLGALSQLVPSGSVQDRIIESYVNSLGQVIGVLDGDGYFTSYSYDKNGQQIEARHYLDVLKGTAPSDISSIIQSIAGMAFEGAQATYDAYGDVVSRVNTQGTQTAYTYDNLGNLIQTTVAVGTADARATSNAYDAFGRLVGAQDGLGNITTFAYDLAGNKTSEVDALGNETWFIYDANNRLTYTVRGVADDSGTKNALGEVQRTDYNAFGEISVSVAYSDRYIISVGGATTSGLQRFSSADPLVTQKNNDADQIVVYERDALGNVVEYLSFDQTLWPAAFVSPLDGHSFSPNFYDGYGGTHIYSYQYDGFGDRLASADQMDGFETQYVYDALGHVVNEVDGLTMYPGSSPDLSHDWGGGNGLRALQWSYNAFGQVDGYIDGNGAVTTFAYDHRGNQVGTSVEVQGATRTTRNTYDALGRLVTQSDAMGLVTSYNFDDINLVEKVTSPGEISTIVALNREGQKSSVTDAMGNVTQYQYDENGRLLVTINADQSTSQNQYDAVGNLVSTTDADGHQIAYTYDAAGRVLSADVDPAGLHLLTTNVYDGRGLLLVTVDPTGLTVRKQYDGNGNVSQQVTGSGATSSDEEVTNDFYYNMLDEVSYETFSSRSFSGYANDDYYYDSMGRLTEADETQKQSEWSNYTYDGSGNVVSSSDAYWNEGINKYTFYDEVAHPVYEITPAGDTADNQYPHTPYWAGYIPPGGTAKQLFYNADGQVVASREYATPLSSSAYAQLSMLSASMGNTSGTLSVVGALITASGDDRISYRVYNAAGQLQYSIDASGAVTETRYNSNGEVSETLAYANPITITSSLAGALQSGQATSADVQGALSTAHNDSSNARITYTYYDARGRASLVIKVATINGQTGGLVQKTDYDADGNVIAVSQYGDLVPLSILGDGSTEVSIKQYLADVTNVRTTRSVYDAAGRQVYSIDANNVVTEMQYDGDGRPTWTYRYANSIQAPAAWTQADVASAVAIANMDISSVRGTGNVYDIFGNIVQVLDKQSSTPVSTYTYDINRLKITSTNRDGQTWAYEYTYDGGLVDRETGPVVAVASYNPDGTYAGTTTSELVSTFDYDDLGILQDRTEAAGTGQARTESYRRDFASQLIGTTRQSTGTVIDPVTGIASSANGTQTVSVAYDAFGDQIVSQDANGDYSYKVYDADGRVAYDIDANGYVTGYQYDAYGEQIAATRYASAIDFSALAGWLAGQPLSLSQVQAGLQPSSSDRTITTTYDSLGNKLSVTQPAITYTKSDGTTAVGSPVTQYTYDAYGNVTSQSVLVEGVPGQASAVWATTFNYYDDLGHQIMAVDPMGYVTTHSYDSFGEVVATTQYAMAIDTAGLVAGGTPPALPPSGDPARTGADRVTQYTYDNDGRKTSESVWCTYVDGAGATVQGFVTTTYGYDGENRVTSVTRNGQTISTQYDALGRVVSITGPQVPVLVDNWQALLAADPSLTLDSPSLYTMASQVVTYAYDANGNCLLQTQGSTGSTQSVNTYSQYDLWGNKVASITQSSSAPLSWASDQVKFMSYDNDNNLISEWYRLTGNDNTSTTVTTTNAYDAVGQLISSIVQRNGIASPDKASTVQYDAFGNVIAKGDGVVESSTNTYDNDGNILTSTDFKTGEVHSYGYNLAGQKVTDTVPLAAAVGGQAKTIYTLDLDGRIVAELAPSTNATSGENTGSIHATYDAWGNVLSSTDAAGNTTTYAYNERNQIVSETEAAVTVVGANGVASTATPVKTNAYDANGNLVASTDENGNITHTVYNALGQDIESIDGAGAVTFTSYDALGNAVASQNGNGNITFKNVDAQGRVVQEGDFVLSSSGTSRTAVWRQAYVLDQNGNRLISYDGTGAAYLQSGDTTNAQLHANFYGYDSQGHILWSQDAAQRAASTANTHGSEASGYWTQQPFNPTFANGTTGWDMLPGWSVGNFGTGPYGPWTALYNGTTGGTSVLYNQDRVPVVPGQTISATAWINVVGDHGGAAVQIQWFDSNGNSLGGPDNEKNSVTAGNGPGASPITATAPPGAAYAIIGVGATNYGDPNNQIYCAGVSWDYVPPAGAISSNPDGSFVVWLPSGSFTQQPSNPDFENGDTGWDKTPGWSIHQQSNTSNGSWVASYNGIGPQTLTNQDRVPVMPGQTITASAQVSLYLAPSGAMAAAGILILWFDASGNQIGYSAGNVVATDHLGEYHATTVTGTAPAGAAYATVAVSANSNGIGSAVVDAVVWNYQYIPSAPAGVVQDRYVYDRDGNLVSKTTADGDTETWAYNAYGQVIRHVDLSGAVYNYTYDAATGEQIGESDNWSPAAQGQQVPSYVTAPIATPNSSTSTYYADGQLATQTFADGSSCSYSYDANGNMTRKEEVTVDGNSQSVHTVTTITYDSHNRISHIVETNAISGATTLDETYTYDAAGNRREVSAISGGTTQDVWYTYDGDNRVAVSGGTLTNGQILVTASADSYQNVYDADGNIINRITINAAGDALAQRSYYDSRDELVRADYAVDVTTGGAWRGIEETRTYDASGHVLITSKFYALGTTLGSQSGHQVDPDSPDGLGGSGTDIGGELDTATIDYYDTVGRLAAEQNFGRASTWDGTDGSAPTTAPGVNATTFGPLNLQSEVVYQGPNASAGYDADGDVVAYQYRDGNGRVDQYAVTYLRKDGYLQSTTSGQNISGTPNVRPTTSESVYDTRGNMVALAQHTQYAGGTVADTVRVFAYDGSGQIIERRDGTASGSTLDQGANPAHENQHYVYVNGQQVAHYDEGGTLDVLAQVTAFSNSDSGTGGYVVQAGDTLKSIAQAIYGNASLWYVIAQANALSSDNDLSIGQNLTIPEVTTNTNDATTFKPYNPGEITGSTTPTLPTIAPPPPPSHHHCNAIADIIVIAVQVVLTVALTPEMGPFAAAFVANVASQATGDVLGVHNGIDFKEALVAAVVNQVGASTIGANPKEGLQSIDAFAGDTANGLNFYGNAVVGAESYATNVAASKIVGESTHFSWAGLVSSSFSNAVSGEIGPSNQSSRLGMTSGDYAQDLTARAVGDVVNRETSVALGDNHVASWAQIGEDVTGYGIGNPIGQTLKPYAHDAAGSIRQAFGNALGNAAIAGINAYNSQQPGYQFDFTKSGQGVGAPPVWGAPGLAQTTSDIAPYARAMGALTYGNNAGDSMGVGPVDYQGGPVYTLHPLDYTLPDYQSAQTFALQDQAPATVEDMTLAQQAAAQPGWLTVEKGAVRGAGAALGAVAAGVEGIEGLGRAGATIYGTARYELFGGDSTDADQLGAAVGHAVDFLSDHPIDHTIDSAGHALNSLNQQLLNDSQLSGSDDMGDQAKAGFDFGKTAFNTVLAVDGGVGLTKLGVTGVGRLASSGFTFVGDTASAIRSVSTLDLGSIPEELDANAISASPTVPSTTGVADSTASLSAPSPSQIARSWQGSGSYPGVDSWTDTNLSKGTFVVGAAPGQSEFYTTLEGFNATDGTAESYYQNLQIGPNTTNPNFPPYRSGVTIYRVDTEGLPAASSNALANPQFGPGGAPQLFIPGYKNSLTPFYSIPFK